LATGTCKISNTTEVLITFTLVYTLRVRCTICGRRQYTTLHNSNKSNAIYISQCPSHKQVWM